MQESTEGDPMDQTSEANAAAARPPALLCPACVALPILVKQCPHHKVHKLGPGAGRARCRSALKVGMGCDVVVECFRADEGVADQGQQPLRRFPEGILRLGYGGRGGNLNRAVG